MLAAGLFYAHSEYSVPGPLAEERLFTVEPGASSGAIGDALERDGIISNGRIFAVMAQLTGQRTALKAGEYLIPRSASMREVMGLIASGRSVIYKLSIPEGFTSEMAVARINANEVLTGPLVAAPPEGAILPETYLFHRGMTRQKLLDAMQLAQTKLLDELWNRRQPVPEITSKEQAVILASIVEKETAIAAERPIIASVFINRLAKGMRLQSDPTIIYGIVGGRGRLDRALTRTDIETTTPYNTYRISGLPPGPIANPGRAALEAVLDPQPTDYLYFVADGTGGHAFAVTLEEHNRNVRKWRQIAGNAAAAAAAGEDDTAPASETPPPPADGSAAGTPAPAAAAGTPPRPTARPAAPPSPGQEATAVPDLEPGTIVMVKGRQAIIPRPRPVR